MAAAATLVLAVALGIGETLRSEDGWKSYTAAIGERRVLTLEDGSVLYLGAGSRVDFRFTEEERRLRLQSGEAMFKVHHDASRPFRVLSGGTMVQAIGTQFSVNRLRGESLITVVEGIVQVSREESLAERVMAPLTRTMGVEQPAAVRLAAGQGIRIAPDGTAAAPRVVDANPMQAWQERRLTFVNETLYAMAEEFNRYNQAPKIRIADPAAGELRYAAAFDADDPESLVVVLERDPKLQIERRGEEIIIRSH